MKELTRLFSRLLLCLVAVFALCFCGCEGSSSDDDSDSDNTPTSSGVLDLGPNIYDLGNGEYAAGIPSDELEFFAAPEVDGRQRKENWCWAACIQMILNFHGVVVSQEEIVSIVFGELANQPASAAQIMYVIDDRIYRNFLGDNFYGLGQEISMPDAWQFIDLLARKWPMIAGLSNIGSEVGHAYLVTAAYFTLDSAGDPVIHTVTLRNPWPASESKEQMSWADLNSRYMFGASLQLVPVGDPSAVAARIHEPIGTMGAISEH